MPTLVNDPPPAEFEELLERRRRLGQDLFDEGCDGVLHVNPAPLRPAPDDVYLPTAALVVEIVSPGWTRPASSSARAGAASWARRKLDFYATHHVDELLIVDGGPGGLAT